ncbi:MAG: hypothetical protein IPM77_15400 [Crocinitomicaceae bacterium]|nr:hypothetical protein [Crocinitomicaceae bacterium]
MKSTFLSLITIVSLTLHAQYNFKAGYGFDNLHIGMSKSGIIETLGEPEEEVTMTNERAMWEDGGYNTAKEMPFVLNFDYLLIFPSNNFYVWKVFMKDEKAIYITVSAYMESEVPKENIVLDGKIKLGDGFSEMLNYLGKPTLRKERESSTIYYFLEKGISVNVDDGLIANFWIYTPMSAKQAKKIKKKIG